ncbi:hypothetical protein [Tuwongella immobilis]|uniref:Uncharacterized protein n=1 Tax=Tuwongella immobilis TaxID=692036 RepID=A0A6C2YIF8_9BACT|nr:hypothetical protein [Tuwongella immobilis]VIP01196.1 unnamed protein product [Tuwongella immobilis]VTR97818.1 unnamed protein product [Tuwongella immobilis]
MSETRRTALALFILIPGVALGWAAWQGAYPLLEPVAVARLGGAGGALALWGLLGVAMSIGYAVAFQLGSRLIRTRSAPT